MAIQQDDDGTLGGLIRSRRQEEKLRIQDLADRTGLSTGYISRIESNLAKNPSDAVVHKLARALKLDPVTIFERIKSPEIQANKGASSDKGEPSKEELAEEELASSSMPSETLNLQGDLDSLHTTHGIPYTGPSTSEPASSAVPMPDTLGSAYQGLAAAYVTLGETYCRTERKDKNGDKVIAYEEGLTAYRAAESICAHAKLLVLLQQIRYRRARTYHSLVQTGGVPKGERLIYLYRAIELLDLVISALTGAEIEVSQQSHDERQLGPASLAISATLFDMIRTENREANRQQAVKGNQHTEQEQLLFEANQNTLAEIREKRRRQADALYKAWIRDLESETEQEVAREKLPYANFLRAMNLKWYEQDKDDASQRDLAKAFKHFETAVTLQRKLIRKAQVPEKARQWLQALARYHTEWGEAYAVSEKPALANLESYTAALWQFQVSRKLAPYPPGLYIAGDEAKLKQYAGELVGRIPDRAPSYTEAATYVLGLLEQMTGNDRFAPQTLDYVIKFPQDLVADLEND